MLLLKKCYFQAVRSGRKTTTLRFWPRALARAGSTHLVPGLGRVRILSAAPVDLADLRLLDARADGFSSLRALRAALERLYPPRRRGGRRLYLVRFQFLGPQQGPPPRRRSLARSSLPESGESAAHGSLAINTVK
jgi:hypothetical protein